MSHIKFPEAKTEFERGITLALERALRPISEFRQVPYGGAAGDMLVKSGDRDFEMTWSRVVRSGSVTLNVGLATVTLSPAEPDTGYRIILSPGANETVWWSNKQVGQFTINSSNGASVATVDWVVVRQ